MWFLRKLFASRYLPAAIAQNKHTKCMIFTITLSIWHAQIFENVVFSARSFCLILSRIRFININLMHIWWRTHVLFALHSFVRGIAACLLLLLLFVCCACDDHHHVGICRLIITWRSGWISARLAMACVKKRIIRNIIKGSMQAPFFFRICDYNQIKTILCLA